MSDVRHNARSALPALMLAGTALLFSTGGAAIKALSLNGTQTVAFRSLVAASVLYAAIPEARRKWTRRTLLVALAYAATLATYVYATKLTTAANAVFLQATAPLYLLLIGPLLLKETLRRTDAWMGLLVATGMALFLAGNNAPQATAPNPALGNMLGVISGVTWALTLAGMRWIARSSSGNALPVVVAGNLLVFALTLPEALPMPAPAWKDIALILHLGCFQIGLSYVLLTRAIGRVPVFEASLILLLEPVSNPIWSWLVHGERMDAWSLAGAAFVLAGVAWQAWCSRNQPAGGSS